MGTSRVYAHTVWRLLVDPVLPFDYSEHATQLVALVDELATTLGDFFDFGRLRQGAETLRSRAVRRQALAARLAKNGTAGMINKVNATARRAVTFRIHPRGPFLARPCARTIDSRTIQPKVRTTALVSRGTRTARYRMALGIPRSCESQ